MFNLSILHLQTNRPNIVFMVTAALEFAMRHPDTVALLPIKMTKILFGSGIGVSTLRLLRTLTWRIDEGKELPIFFSILPDQAMKVTDCQVVFDPRLIDSVKRSEVEKCQKEVFHGLLDVTRLAFQYAEREITGEFDDWTPRSIEKMVVSELIATQTSEGSTLKRKVKYCPVCRKKLGILFYGTVKQLKKGLRGIPMEKSGFIIGNPSAPDPKPRWMCSACQLKIWSADEEPPFGLENGAK